MRRVFGREARLPPLPPVFEPFGAIGFPVGLLPPSAAPEAAVGLAVRGEKLGEKAGEKAPVLICLVTIRFGDVAATEGKKHGRLGEGASGEEIPTAPPEA